jgi:lactate permease
LTAATILAMLPIVSILVIMLGLRWSASRAGIISLFLTVFIAWLGFGYGTEIYPRIGLSGALGGALTEAIFTAGTILWILFPAMCIHHFQVRTGAIDILRLKTASLSEDPRIVALLIFWFFALFGEGLAGFGTPVVLAVPFLVSVGFRPIDSVAVVLIGHSVGVSFGAVGTPILPQMAATGLDGLALARTTGLFHATLGWVMLFIAMMFITKSLKRDGIHLPESIWGWTALAAALFLLPYFVISRWIGPELPTLGGALFGGLGFIAIYRFYASRKEKPPAAPTELLTGRPGSLIRVTAPYWILVSLILATRLISPLKAALSPVVWRWSFLDSFQGVIAPLYHPGTLIFLGFVAGACFQRAKPAAIKTAMVDSVRMLVPITIALVAMLSISRIMVHAQMIDILSVSAARAGGRFWPVFAPFIGVLGAFVTGSATASNVLFSEFQQTAAQNLGLPVLTMVGAQGFGAAVGNIICPHNIIAGAATVGMTGQEGKILAKTIVACLIYSTLGGLFAFWLVS